MAIKQKNKKIIDRSAYILNEKSPFRFVVAYNRLRTNVMFSLKALESQSKAIAITSASPEECKSTTSANLAISLAKQQKRVLLIDADLRKPVLHTLFGLQNNFGLSDLLLSGKIENAIVGIGGLNLDFVSAGTVPPNPSELLGSKAMSEFIASVEKFYDFIIIDTPPVLLVPDALMLSEICAGILISCKYKKSSLAKVTKAVSDLKMAKFNILGTIITGTSQNSITSYYG